MEWSAFLIFPAFNISVIALGIVLHTIKQINQLEERDLNNDGIEIADTRNYVQTVKDLDPVNNSTSRSTQRYNQRQEESVIMS